MYFIRAWQPDLENKKGIKEGDEDYHKMIIWSSLKIGENNAISIHYILVFQLLSSVEYFQGNKIYIYDQKKFKKKKILSPILFEQNP